jgi:outer membrane lipopolysaccharide assembly protein LptE/RlpB
MKALKVLLRSLFLLALIGLLSACGTAGIPPTKQIVKQAIALQVGEAQTLLAEELRLKYDRSPSLDISQIAIQEQSPLVIQNLPAYHLRGTYTVTFKLPKRQVTQRGNGFDLYLQSQKELKTWRLARLQVSEGETTPQWVTQLIPPR